MDPIENGTSLLFMGLCIAMGDIFDYEGSCLLRRYIATAVSSGSTVLAVRKPVTRL
jgi:hypothetical protein